MGKEAKAKALRRALYGDASRRERQYGVVVKDGLPTGQVIEVGLHGEARRIRRGKMPRQLVEATRDE